MATAAAARLNALDAGVTLIEAVALVEAALVEAALFEAVALIDAVALDEAARLEAALVAGSICHRCPKTVSRVGNQQVCQTQMMLA